jgi:hypothetical protein
MAALLKLVRKASLDHRVKLCRRKHRFDRGFGLESIDFKPDLFLDNLSTAFVAGCPWTLNFNAIAGGYADVSLT